MEILEKMRSKGLTKKVVSTSIITVLTVSLLAIPNENSFADTDYSLYKVETGGIIGEDNTKRAIEQLKADTGWYATYKHTGTTIPYYQIVSGGFKGEANVTEKLKQFQDTTGFTGTYIPFGEKEYYSTVVTGGFFGEENAQNVLNQFTANTGFKGTVENTGQSQFKRKIISGGFLGEANVQSILEQFKNSTGISAEYEPVGSSEYYKLVSGGFRGEANVQNILQNFVNLTGIGANYEPIQYDETYIVKTGGFIGQQKVEEIVSKITADLGMTVIYEPTGSPDVYRIVFNNLSADSLLQVTDYLKLNNWWHFVTSGEKVASIFRIVTDKILDNAKQDQVLNYFKSNNWWAVLTPTGETASTTFRIVSEPLEEGMTIESGLNFFKSNNWWVTTASTNIQYYPIYRVVTEPLLGKEKIERALSFFKSNNWWVTTKSTVQTGYTTFKIVSDPLLGEDKRDKAINFFKDNNYYVSSNLTGATEGVYKITTGAFQGLVNVQAAVNKVKELYGWWVNILTVQDIKTTSYKLSLGAMIDLQMTRSPQTDLYRNDPAYVSMEYINANNTVTASSLNIRSEPNPYNNGNVIGAIKNGDKVTPLGTPVIGSDGKKWTRILLTWRNAKREDVTNYLNPNIQSGTPEYLQFMKLNVVENININEVNEKILYNAGTLKGTAAAFAKAAKDYGVNEFYLIAHAMHETGNGKSTLAQGVIVNGVKVYNMFGFAAFDSCANSCGAQKAFEEGWTTPEKAILGGAKLISERYINKAVNPQDTLYEMRWHEKGYPQYATDIAWAVNQSKRLYTYYQLIKKSPTYFDVPNYQ